MGWPSMPFRGPTKSFSRSWSLPNFGLDLPWEKRGAENEQVLQRFLNSDRVSIRSPNEKHLLHICPPVFLPARERNSHPHKRSLDRLHNPANRRYAPHLRPAFPCPSPNSQVELAAGANPLCALCVLCGESLPSPLCVPWRSSREAGLIPSIHVSFFDHDQDHDQDHDPRMCWIQVFCAFLCSFAASSSLPVGDRNVPPPLLNLRSSVKSAVPPSLLLFALLGVLCERQFLSRPSMFHFSITIKITIMITIPGCAGSRYFVPFCAFCGSSLPNSRPSAPFAHSGGLDLLCQTPWGPTKIPVEPN